MNTDKIDKIYALKEHHSELMDSASDAGEYYQAYTGFSAVCEILEILGE